MVKSPTSLGDILGPLIFGVSHIHIGLCWGTARQPVTVRNGERDHRRCPAVDVWVASKLRACLAALDNMRYISTSIDVYTHIHMYIYIHTCTHQLSTEARNVEDHGDSAVLNGMHIDARAGLAVRRSGNFLPSFPRPSEQKQTQSPSHF